MKNRRYRRLIGCMLFALALALVVASPFGQRFERDNGLSSLYALRGDIEVPPEALIVALDQPSVDWLQFHARDFSKVSPRLDACLSPETKHELETLRNVGDMPREIHACVLGELQARGSRLTVFDILFHVERAIDPVFAQAIGTAGNVILFDGIREEETPAGRLRRAVHSREIFAREALSVGIFLVGSPFGDFVEGYVTRLDEYPDYVALPRLAWQHFTDQAPSPAPTSTARLQPIWLYGPPRAIPTYSIRDIFATDSANPLPVDLSSRAAFVGVSDPDDLGSEDHFKTPISDRRDNDIGGVELAASAFLNLLHGDRLAKPPPLVTAGLVFAFGMAVGLAAGFLRGLRGLWWIAVVAGLYLAASTWAFVNWRIWLPFGVPLYLGVTGALLIALATRYAFARSLVSYLTPRPVAGQMLESQTAQERGVHQERATVMFTDLVGSTALGESLPLERYTALMSYYYDHATEAIEAHGGLVVEFMGDGILAVFPESISGADHAGDCCRAAARLSRNLRDNPTAGNEIDRPTTLRIRVGIHTGQTATGRIGASHRFSFKALGDTVNTASRLEQIGKEIGQPGDDRIVVSEETRVASGLPDLAFEPLGAYRLRGKARQTELSLLNISAVDLTTKR